VSKAKEREVLWEEIKDTAVKVARIKAYRDLDWYAKAVPFVLRILADLLDGMVQATQSLRIANGLEETEDAE